MNPYWSYIERFKAWLIEQNARNVRAYVPRHSGAQSTKEAQR